MPQQRIAMARIVHAPALADEAFPESHSVPSIVPIASPRKNWRRVWVIWR